MWLIICDNKIVNKMLQIYCNLKKKVAEAMFIKRCKVFNEGKVYKGVCHCVYNFI